MAKYRSRDDTDLISIVRQLQSQVASLETRPITTMPLAWLPSSRSTSSTSYTEIFSLLFPLQLPLVYVSFNFTGSGTHKVTLDDVDVSSTESTSTGLIEHYIDTSEADNPARIDILAKASSGSVTISPSHAYGLTRQP